MTEIKTAQAWWDTISGIVVLRTSEAFALDALPHVVTVVHGLTEAEVHEAAERLAKSREVCEWYLSENQHGEYDFCSSCDAEYQMRMPTFCPSCGRKVVVKDD